MPSLTNHIDRIVKSGECLCAVEIFLLLDGERSSPKPLTIAEIVASADKMSNLLKSGKEYRCKHEENNDRSGSWVLFVLTPTVIFAK
jgi:hypothetical protein